MTLQHSESAGAICRAPSSGGVQGDGFYVLQRDGTVVHWSGQADDPVASVSGVAGAKYICPAGYITAAGAAFTWSGNAYASLDTGVAITSGAVSMAYNGNAVTVYVLTDAGDVVLCNFDSSSGDTKAQYAPPVGLSDIVSLSCSPDFVASQTWIAAVDSTGKATGFGAGSARDVVPHAGSHYDSIVFGSNHGLGLKADGTVEAWGVNGSGQTTVPSALTGVASIAAVNDTSYAVQADGTVVGWGSDAAADGLAGVSKLVVSHGLSGIWGLALHTDGHVTGFGDNDDGQTTIPSTLADVQDIAIGVMHALALNGDGTVVAWGDNTYDQTTAPAGLAGVTAITAAGNASAALKSDKTIAVWGETPTIDDPSSYVSAPASATATQVVANGVYLAIQNDGTVAAWGYTDHGLTTVPAGLSDAASVYIDDASKIALAIKTDRTVVAWGDDSQGVVTGANAATNVAKISISGSHAVCLHKDGTVSAWGNAAGGQTTVPTGLGTITDVVAVSGGAAVVDDAGNLTVWGSNASALGNGHTFTGTVALEYVSNPGVLIVHSGTTTHQNRLFVLFLGGFAPPNTSFNAISMALALAGGIYCTLSGDIGTFVASQAAYTLTSPPTNAKPAAKVYVKSSSAYALTTAGKVVAWPYKFGGDLDDLGEGIPADLSGVMDIAFGLNHAVALHSDGTVSAWGDNTFGQTDVPVGLSDVASIIADHNSSAAVKADGTVVTWGYSVGFQDLASIYLDCIQPPNAGTLFLRVTTALGLASDGTLYGSRIRTTNIGTTVDSSPYMPPVRTDTTIASITAGDGAAVRYADGTVFALAPVPTGLFASPGTGWSGFSQVADNMSDLADVSGIWAANGIWMARCSTGVYAARGYGAGNPAAPPPGLIGVSRIAGCGGPSPSAAAAMLDGTVLAWGVASDGAASVPAGLTDVVNVGAAAEGMLALKMDGTVAGWGKAPWGGFSDGPVEAPTLTKVTAIADGMALHRDRSLSYWGAPPLPAYDQTTNIFTDLFHVGANMMASTTDGRSVAWGHGGDWYTARLQAVTAATVFLGAAPHVMCVNADGTIAEWLQYTGASGDQLDSSQFDYVLKDATRFSDYDLGPFSSLGVNAAGRVEMWGDTITAPVPDGLQLVQHVAAGRGHFMAQLAGGTVTVWGDNSKGQVLGASSITDAVDVAAGSFHCLALLGDGTVAAWGDNSKGQCDVPTGLTDVVVIEAAKGQDAAGISLAIKADNTVVAWGDNSEGQTDVPADLKDVLSVSATSTHCLAVVADGTVVQWGSSSVAPPPANLSGVVSAIAHSDGGFAAHRDGSVTTWGTAARLPRLSTDRVTKLVVSPVFAAVDDTQRLVTWGNYTSNVVPVPATYADASVADFVFTTDAGDIIVRLADGTVAAWGNNAHGECDVPAALTTVTALSAGAQHVLALRADGSVAAWGDNEVGQTTVPDGLANVAHVYAFQSASYALLDDGTVAAWGQNNSGETTVPAGLIGVASLHFCRAVSDNSVCVLALKTDGTVGAWGANPDGMTTVPDGLAGVAELHIGASFVAALHSDGTVSAWGDDDAGQTTVPAGATGVVALAVDSGSTLALKEDGTVVGWGLNNVGQVTIPTGLADVVEIKMGGGFSAARKSDGSLMVWGANFDAQDTIPTHIAAATVLGVQLGNYAMIMLPKLAVTGAASSTAPAAYDVTATAALGLGVDHASTPTFVTAAALALGAAPATLLDGLQHTQAGLRFTDVSQAVLKILLSEALALGATPTHWGEAVAQMVDALALVAGPDSLLDARQAVASALPLHDASAFVWPSVMRETLAMAATLDAGLDGATQLVDALALAAVPTGRAQFAVLVQADAALGDAVDSTADLRAHVRAGLAVQATFHLPSGQYIAWVLQAGTNSYTRYSNFPFNSFCELDGHYYGATDTGLYLLEGDDDAGDPIDAHIRGGLEDMGTGLLKRMESLYLGYRATGALVLKVVTTSDGGEKREDWYALTAQPADVMREGRIKIGRGLKSRYWGFEMANVDGGDFELDTMAWLPMVLERRI